MPDDFREFQQVMEVEFGTRFNKLFRGPMWSGQVRNNWNDPLKVHIYCLLPLMNVHKASKTVFF